ncbi:unnamed protein product [Nezara viridula]|uniref:Acetyl-coenzyme A transporter 1 n=1 Tax=Nezara viridula TaxID=85310 RepID=A0A9P0H8V4_NEZVI|nr:unnamed protein product [Nezara viridula]
MSEVRRRQLQSTESLNSVMVDISNIRGDEWNIALLLLLYLLQGIPLGLAAALPMILQNRGASFKQQAAFSFATWPFSLKLFWAPIVDSVYLARFGRRKTWLVPIQLAIGCFLIFLSYNLEAWLGIEGTDEPQVVLLSIIFFLLNFLVATQDIVVDGWALTLLRRENIEYASTCNSAGQIAGYFFGYVIFMALECPEFCNTYIRNEPKPEGIITMPGFFYFWGVVYLVVTALVAFIKREAQEYSSNTPTMATIVHSYRQLLQILKLPSIQLLSLVLLTSKVGFAACDSVTGLKLTEGGVPKESLALLAVPLLPLQIILPLVVSKISSRRRPLNLLLKVFPYRLVFNIIAAVFVFITPAILVGSSMPSYYVAILLVLLALQQVTVTTMFVQWMAFFAVISDPVVGGTYMTLLNTLNNLGGTWTTTTALALVDFTTVKSCSNSTLNNDCSSQLLKMECEKAGGNCEVQLDGYYIETALLTIVGFIWFKFWGQKILLSLQSRPMDAWKVRSR